MNVTAGPDLSVDYSVDAAAVEGDCLTSTTADALPDEAFVKRWVQIALRAPESLDAVMASADRSGETLRQCSVSVHLTGAPTSQALNRELRGADRPTNVLSFPADLPVLDGTLALGELVLCPAVVRQEAVEQHKRLPDHWAHLLLHGTLHLIGFDHVQDVDAELMERLETRLLSESGISDPYEGTV